MKPKMLKSIKPQQTITQKGYLSIEQSLNTGMIEGEVGFMYAEDGKFWICVNGRALLRFRPNPL